ncbi:hypothetical protein [Saccharopolyspora sp. NPDC002686]|uniref:hypothetical protein n=1 Tax=Saccharopolyspora sp. NPDC002686 TaxID=3154541 RepID=UPI00331FEACC
MRFDHNSHAPSPRVGIVLSHFATPRMQGYLDACGGDPAAALDLYRWNAQMSGALWETLGHLEVVLRNVLADRLAARSAAAGRSGSWLDDTARELDDRARRDITKARQRVRAKGKAASNAQTLTELPFGFWRFLLARRYATTLWPDLASGFPGAPDRARSTIEQPVTRLHELRNRLAHHERVWNLPLKARYDDIVALLGYVDSDLLEWVAAGCRVTAALAACPIERPHP